jgi:hypothetical protein
LWGSFAYYFVDLIEHFIGNAAVTRRVLAGFNLSQQFCFAVQLQLKAIDFFFVVLNLHSIFDASKLPLVLYGARYLHLLGDPSTLLRIETVAADDSAARMTNAHCFAPAAI